MREYIVCKDYGRRGRHWFVRSPEDNYFDFKSKREATAWIAKVMAMKAERASKASA